MAHALRLARRSLTFLGAAVIAASAAAPGAQASDRGARFRVTIRTVSVHASVAEVRTRTTRWGPGFVLRLYVDGRFNNYSRSRTGIVHGIGRGRSVVRAGLYSGRRRLALSRPVVVRVRAPAGPLAAAAGDIACDPADPAFADGRGTPSSCRAAATANVVSRARPSAVLPLGDLQYECGSREAFARSYALSWGRFDAIAHPVPGNHEYYLDANLSDPHLPCDATPGFFDVFAFAAASGGYYSYDIGAWHAVALNSECGFVPGGCGAGSPQERWLRADLAAHPTACTLAYWHRPRWSLYGGGPASMSQLWSDLAAGGVDVVLSGHEHFYARFAHLGRGGEAAAGGIRQFIVGTGGKNLRVLPPRLPTVERLEAKYGVLLLRLAAHGYEWAFAPVMGESFTDAGADACR